MLKRREPKNEPWGTPHNTSDHELSDVYFIYVYT